MRLLLDSHAFLWFMAGTPKLSHAAKEAILEAEDVYVSLASVWELTIKRSLGRLGLDVSPAVMVAEGALDLLPIELRHLDRLEHLPPVHRDPFDRLLVAQAMEDGLVLVTADRTLQHYPVAWLW
ncbi:MAG: type II toxin-antitoxin system VapC family toxin [Geminicoccaceae bacterium]